MADWRDRRGQPDTPLDLWEILAEEFEQDGKRLPVEFDVLANAAVEAKGKGLAEDAAREAARQELFQLLGAQPRTALCFSGGGVRSATFGLGVMQGLGTCTLAGSTALSQFDYLSTVSGGGYAGGWFSAWAKRKEAAGAPNGPQAVEGEMQQPGPSLDPDPAPLGYIRRYCAFLDPKLGLLSADTWTLASTVLRNMVLNWLILVPFLMAALLLPKMYRALLHLHPDETVVRLLLAVGTVLAFMGNAYIASHLPTFSGGTKDGEGMFVFKALLPLTGAAVTLSLHWHLMHLYPFRTPFYFDPQWNYSWWTFLLYGALLHAAGWIGGIFLFRKRLAAAGQITAMLQGTVAAVVSGLVAGGLAWLITGAFNNRYALILKVIQSEKTKLSLDDWHLLTRTMVDQYHNWYACLGAPAVLAAFLSAAVLVVGLASKKTGDEDREWWARAGAWIMIVIFAWIAATATVLLGPGLLKGWISQLATAAGSVGLGGIASWLGFSPSTGAGRRGDKDSQSQRSSPVKDAALKAAGPVFLWLLLVMLATANQDMLNWLPEGVPLLVREFFLLAIFAAVTLLCSPFINVNRFSLHAMYRDRLIRTYLGASRPDRSQTVNPFTDFDEKDNLNLADLSTSRPLHIVNMALNLVGGKNLAWQQRKAESFTASRLRTGSLRVGYQNTRHYAGKLRGATEGLSLGSAIAISGAAASPNMGYHSSPLIALIMTLFNARLGWWLANPGEHGKGAWDKEGPSVAFQPIINEALGRTNDTSKWVYLSDGGHFENLGLYEMVLRRCRTIVVVDGSEDGNYNFEDLGNAIQKIRVDLGVSIEFPTGIPIFSATELRNRYCAIADIHYECKDPGAQPGKLLYVKACLNGTEPEDVLHYAAMNPDFPQQGTDQLWFDESQFESYRRLGLHVVQQICGAVPATATGGTIDSLIAHAAAYIESDPPIRHTRWPKTPHFIGAISGTIGGPAVDLKADFQSD
jgi:hypothetical protein